MKNRIRLTESQLHQIIGECVNKCLNETYDLPDEGNMKVIYGLPIVNGIAITVLDNGIVCITTDEDSKHMERREDDDWSTPLNMNSGSMTKLCTQAFNTFDEAKYYCMKANKILGREVFSPHAMRVNHNSVLFDKPNKGMINQQY